MGGGLAVRLALDTDHTVLIGSRTVDRATNAAAEYESRVERSGGTPDIDGTSNAATAGSADLVVLAVPPKYADRTAAEIAETMASGTVLVSPVVEMTRNGKSMLYDHSSAVSIAEQIDAVTPETVPVVGAFQNVPAGLLSDLESDLSVDVVVTGDDDAAKKTVMTLTSAIDGLRALDGGRLRDTKFEHLTPLLVTLALNNDGLHDVGVNFR